MSISKIYNEYILRQLARNYSSLKIIITY